MVLVFDTETTGKPKNWKAPASDLDNWPRVVQLAFELYDLNGVLANQGEYLIAPSGFVIPEEASAVNRITTELALRDGESIDSALDDFLTVLDEAHFLVAHNTDFDWPVLNAELERAGKRNPLNSKKLVCTMKNSTEFCAISGSYGLKWPSLHELHTKLFGTGFNDAHHAAVDVAATAKCFWELHRLGVITLEAANDAVVLSPLAESLLERVKEYCRNNQFEDIPIGPKAVAISFLATNFKRVPEGADVYEEFRILRKMYPDESHPMILGTKLSEGQESFLFSIKKEIISEHKDSPTFKGEKNKTLEEKMMSLDVLSLMMPSDSKRLRDLVAHLYFYYLVRYAGSQVEGEAVLDGKPTVQDDYAVVSAAVKHAHQHLKGLIEAFMTDGNSVRNGGVPDHVLKLVLAGKEDLEFLKEELGVSHALYISAATSLIEHAAGVLFDWMKSMPYDLLRTPIQGLSHGRNFQELSFYVLGKIDQLEMGEDARQWFNHMAKSVGYAQQNIQTTSTGHEKKSVWKKLFG